jgi:protein-L-isoaspartate(D-aspartate) O-methyltransferase
MILEDSYIMQGRRQVLVEELIKKGIVDAKVLKAIGKVARHYFFTNTFQHHAYEDKAFPIGEGQTISQPYTVAFQTQLLELKPLQKVLEIGTGSGYQASILAECGARVFTIERQKKLFDITKPFLEKLGYDTKIKCFYGDGYKGLPTYAPFDKIIITAAAPIIPQLLKDQLAIGGQLIIPYGETVSKMLRITKLDEERFHEEQFHEFKFVPMLGGKAV